MSCADDPTTLLIDISGTLMSVTASLLMPSGTSGLIVAGVGSDNIVRFANIDSSQALKVTGSVSIAAPVFVTSTGSLPVAVVGTVPVSVAGTVTVSGSFGTQDAAGRQIVVGPAQSGSTAQGAPVFMGGTDNSKVVRGILTDAGGVVYTSGSSANEPVFVLRNATLTTNGTASYYGLGGTVTALINLTQTASLGASTQLNFRYVAVDPSDGVTEIGSPSSVGPFFGNDIPQNSVLDLIGNNVQAGALKLTWSLISGTWPGVNLTLVPNSNRVTVDQYSTTNPFRVVLTDTGGINEVGTTARPAVVGATLGTSTTIDPLTSQAIKADLSGSLFVAASWVDNNNSTSTPLAGGGNFTGVDSPTNNCDLIDVFVRADKQSADPIGVQVQWNKSAGAATQFDNYVYPRADGVWVIYRLKVKGPFFRLSYINGGAAQSQFNIVTVFRHTSLDTAVVDAQTLTSSNATYTGTSYASLTAGSDGTFARVFKTDASGVQYVTTSGSLPISGAFGIFDAVGRRIVVGPVQSGSTAQGAPVIVGGVDTNNIVRGLSIDTAGRQVAVGAIQSGSTAQGSPVLVAGADTNKVVRGILTDAGGAVVVTATGSLAVAVLNTVAVSGTMSALDNANREITVGAVQSGSTAQGAPVLVAGVDNNSVVRVVSTDTSGRIINVGTTATGSTMAGNPQFIAGVDSNNVTRGILTDAGGAIAATVTGSVAVYTQGAQLISGSVTVTTTGSLSTFNVGTQSISGSVSVVANAFGNDALSQITVLLQDILITAKIQNLLLLKLLDSAKVSVLSSELDIDVFNQVKETK